MNYELGTVKCPRCKKNYLFKEEALNALSRRDNMTYICPECGVQEALIDLTGEKDDLTWIPLTQIKAEHYILHNGNQCPYCESLSITTTEFPDASDGYAQQECRCYECGKRWRDVYVLTMIEEVVEE